MKRASLRPLRLFYIAHQYIMNQFATTMGHLMLMIYPPHRWAKSPFYPGRHTFYPMKYHYNDVILSAMACEITSLTIAALNRLFGCRSNKTSKLRVTSLCARNSPVTGEFPHKWPVARKMFPFDNVMIMTHIDLLGFVWVCFIVSCLHC